MAPRHEIDSLLLYDPATARTTANVWVAHPTPLEEETLGKLFLVSGIDSAQKINHEIISIIQDELKGHYYLAAEFKPERAFEVALQKTNERLHQLIIEGVNDWIDKAHITVGVIHRQSVILSSAGAMSAYILRRGKLHDIFGPHDAGGANPLRLFGEVVSGQLETADQILVSTPSLFDYFSLEKLRRVMMENDPHHAVRLLESTLLGVERQTSFATLLIKLSSMEASAPIRTTTVVPPTTRNAPQISMEELIRRERTTEKILTPSVWPALRDTAQQVKRIVGDATRTTILRQPPKRRVPVSPAPTVEPRPTNSSSRVRPQLRWLKMIVAALASSAILGWQRLARVFRQRRTITPPSLEAYRPSSVVNRGAQWWQELPSRQRWLLGAACLLVLVLTVTLVQRDNAPSVVRGQKRDEVVQSVQGHLSKAEAALLYGGESTAQTELTAAQTLVARLPNKSKKDQAVVAPLTTRITAITNKLAKVVDPETSVVATISAVDQPEQLLKVGTNLVALSAKDNAGVVITTDETTRQVASRPAVDVGAILTATPVSATNILALTDRQGLIEWNTTNNTWKVFDVRLPTGAQQLQSVSFFQNRAYVLDQSTSAILRFVRGTSSYGTGTNWLKQTADLSKAQAAVVDGSIFVLGQTTQVDEYVSGSKTSFTLATTQPAAKQFTRLWTDTASSSLYLLEPTQQRLLVFKKDGSFLRQYRDSQWKQLRDMVIDEKAGTGYVLNGTDIESFDLIK